MKRENPDSLPLLVDLFEAMNACDMRYCHWKSNYRLAESLQGKTDLDLLIDPEQQEVFERMLRERGILKFQPAPGRRYPGIENHLGFDPVSGKLVHLHVHYRLVLGEQFVKNYHLPLEEAFLNSVQLRYGVKTPVPELEIIILSLRALLKYRDRDGLKDILSIRSAGLPLHIRKEIEWLRRQTTREHVAQMLGTISDEVPSDLVLEFLDTVSNNPRAGRRLLRLRRDVRRALQRYQRQDRWEASQKYFRTIWQRRSFMNQAAGKRMTLENGGMRVAFIGADGAGKTTLIRELTRWLSWRLTVRTFYMGSSQPYWVTRVVKGLSKFTQRVYSGVQHIFGAKSPIAKPLGSLNQLLAHLRYLSEARDRYRRYEASCLEADQGAIVFYDRYPLDSIHIFGRPVDGPRIAPNEDGRMGRISGALSRAEQELYRKIRPPEHVVILQVSPEVSQRRKPDHKWELIAAKSQALEAVTRNGFELTKIDAHGSLEQVLRQVKPVLWRLMG